MVTHVGSSIITASSGSLPTHQAGDLLIVTAVADSATIPSLPAGWTSLLTEAPAPGASAYPASARVGWREAPGSGTASGTWTNATALIVSVYRGTDGIGASAITGEANSTANQAVPGLSLAETDGSSTVLVHWTCGATGAYSSGPSGMTRIAGTGSTSRGAFHAASQASFAARSITVPGSGTGYVSASIEILSGAQEEAFSGSETRTPTATGMFFPGFTIEGSETRAATGIGVFEDITGQREETEGSETRAATGIGVFTLGQTFAGSLTGTPTEVGVFHGATENGHITGERSSGHSGFGQFVFPPPPSIVIAAARTLDAVVAGSGPRGYRATIINGPLEGTVLPLVNGDIGADGSGPRTGTLEIARDHESLVTALDPLARTEILIEAGVRDDHHDWHYWPLGTMHPTMRPLVAASGTITISISDRAAWAALAGMRQRYVAGPNASIALTILGILGERVPWLPVEIVGGDPGYRFPAAGGVFEPEDPWAHALTLARSIACDLRVHPDGVARLTRRIDPADVEPVATWRTGKGGTLTGAALSGLDDAAFANVICVPWVGPTPEDAEQGYVPPSGTSVAEDATSPLGTGIHGDRVRWYKGDASVITSAAQAADIATSELVTAQSASASASVSGWSDPRRDLDDVIHLIDAEHGTGLDHRMLITSLSIPLAEWSFSAELGVARDA